MRSVKSLAESVHRGGIRCSRCASIGVCRQPSAFVTALGCRLVDQGQSRAPFNSFRARVSPCAAA